MFTNKSSTNFHPQVNSKVQPKLPAKTTSRRFDSKEERERERTERSDRDTHAQRERERDREEDEEEGRKEHKLKYDVAQPAFDDRVRDAGHNEEACCRVTEGMSGPYAREEMFEAASALQPAGNVAAEPQLALPQIECQLHRVVLNASPL